MGRQPTDGFDAASYKETTREQWQEAAEAWRRLAAARRAGADGRVLAADLSPRILELAADEARAAGLENVATQVADGERLDVDAGAFDAAISRLGLMYFPDKLAALASLRRALRSGGRAAFVVFAEAEANGFFTTPIAIVRRRAGPPAPPPGAPGPFSAIGVGDLLADAGFDEIEVQRLAAPLRLRDAATCTRFERESFGALHQMLAGLVGPCTLLLAAGMS